MKYEVIVVDKATNKEKILCDSYSYNETAEYLNVYFIFEDRVNWRTFMFKDLRYIKITRIEVIKEVTL